METTPLNTSPMSAPLQGLVSACGTDRAVVAIFEDRNAAEIAVDNLRQAGFDEDSLGFAIRGSDAVLGGMLVDAEGAKDAKGAVTGAAAGAAIGGTLAAVGALLIPGVGPVLAGGVIAAFFGGAVAGTAVGGILGAMTGLGISEEEAKFYEKHFNEGKAIVAVKAGPRYREAMDILSQAGGKHIHCEFGSPVRTEGPLSTP
jgi:hypothetical protein